MFAHLSSKVRTARSFGGLRMTVKVEGCHPKALSFCIHPADSSLNGLLLYTATTPSNPMFANDHNIECHPEASEGSGCCSRFFNEKCV